MKKITITIITFAFFAVSCNQPTRSQTTTESKNTQIAIQQTDDEFTKSFVVSCGTGCALVYTAKQITRTASSIKVEFEVRMYFAPTSEDDVEPTLEEIFYSSYVFIYDEENNLHKLMPKGENVI